MSDERGPHDRHARRPWPLYALAALVGLSAAALLIGAVLALPHGEHAADAARSFEQALGLAGAGPLPWRGAVPNGTASSGFAWTALERSRLTAADRARGAFVARSCTTCHGRDGIGGSELAPALAGQRAEVLLKQLQDFRSGARVWPVMNAVAQALAEADLAAVSAYLAGVAPAAADCSAAAAAPALVSAGDSRRRLAPCVACHTTTGELGVATLAPRLDRQRDDYLARQLELFQAGWRHNDVYGHMRSVARSLRRDEIAAVARWYAAAPPPRCGGPSQ